MPVNPAAFALFVAVDANRSGTIDARELHMALSNGGWTSFSFKTIKLLMRMFDTDFSGSCACPKGRMRGASAARGGPRLAGSRPTPSPPPRQARWATRSLSPCCSKCRAVRYAPRPPPTAPATATLSGPAPTTPPNPNPGRSWFDAADADRSGKLSPPEMARCLRSFGFNLPEATMYAVFNAVDLDSSGTIGFDEFVQVLAEVNALTAGFRRYDVGGAGRATLEYAQFMHMVFATRS